jgi:hypothetical protein
MKFFPARTTWVLADFGPIFTRTLFPGVLQVSFKGFFSPLYVYFRFT